MNNTESSTDSVISNEGCNINNNNNRNNIFNNRNIIVIRAN